MSSVDTRGKHCQSCGRRITYRRRWQENWDAVRYCSRACRARGVSATDRRLEQAILDILADRARGASMCPSEAARAVASNDAWPHLMEPARRAARRLERAGRIEIMQKGRAVDPSEFRGPVRIRAMT